MSVQKGAWASGLCECCAAGPGTCLMATCCPCILFGQNNSALAAKRPGTGGDCVTQCCIWIFASAVGVPCFIHSPFRKQVRDANEVQSSNDCIITCCFPCCAMIQEANMIANLK